MNPEQVPVPQPLPPQPIEPPSFSQNGRSGRSFRSGFVILTGAFIFIICLIIVRSSQIPSNYVKTNATVTNVVNAGNCGKNDSDTNYQLTINFTVNEKPYTWTQDYCGSEINKDGQVIQIAYNPSNPSSNPKISSYDILQYKSADYGVLSIGIIVMIVGVFVLIRQLTKPQY